MAERLKSALPFADMLFIRETEAQNFDTPEQRAALERRLRRSVGKIADETSAPPLPGGHGASPRGVLRRRAPSSAETVGREGEPSARGAAGLSLHAARASASLRRPWRPRAGSPAKAAHPAREIVILAIVLGHPVITGAPLRGAGRDSNSPAPASARSAMRCSPLRRRPCISPTHSQAAERRGRSAECERIVALAARMPNWWCMRPEAAVADAEYWCCGKAWPCIGGQARYIGN